MENPGVIVSKINLSGPTFESPIFFFLLQYHFFLFFQTFDYDNFFFRYTIVKVILLKNSYLLFKKGENFPIFGFLGFDPSHDNFFHEFELVNQMIHRIVNFIILIRLPRIMNKIAEILIINPRAIKFEGVILFRGASFKL